MTAARATSAAVVVTHNADGVPCTSIQTHRLLHANAAFLDIPQAAAVEHDERGAPSLRGTTRNVSFTHDDCWAAAATADCALGVDLQQTTAVTPAFRRRLDCTTDSDAAASWSIREAIAKCRGKGLADAPWRYDLSLQPDAQAGTFAGIYWYRTEVADDIHLSVAATQPLAINVRTVS